MEKISGILPPSTRTRAVDLSEALPVRPGVPTFGRPVGVSHGRINTEARYQLKAQTKPNLDPISTDEKVAIVKNITDGFFIKDKVNLTKSQSMESLVTPEKTLFETQPLKMKVAEEDLEHKTEENLDQPVRGGRLNVVA